jgi:hypothetical protein
MRCDGCNLGCNAPPPSYFDGREDGIANSIDWQRAEMDVCYLTGFLDGVFRFETFLKSRAHLVVEPFEPKIVQLRSGISLEIRRLKRPDLSKVDGATLYEDNHALH